MSARILMCGNEALAEAAILAGCDAYFGYPITPQNEITAYMSRRMAEEGRVFVQSESELAAINMVFGAATAGERRMRGQRAIWDVHVRKPEAESLTFVKMSCVRLLADRRKAPRRHDMTARSLR